MLQVVLVDGFGILHPRACGSASHLGVQSSIATIGVAKALLHMPDLTEKHICSVMRQSPGTETEALPGQSAECDSRLHDGRQQCVYSPTSVTSTYATDPQLAFDGLSAVPSCQNPRSNLQPGSSIKPNDVSSALTHPLVSNGKLVGMAVRTSARVERPVYVSVGHGISLPSAVAVVGRCSRYRYSHICCCATQLIGLSTLADTSSFLHAFCTIMIQFICQSCQAGQQWCIMYCAEGDA